MSMIDAWASRRIPWSFAWAALVALGAAHGTVRAEAPAAQPTSLGSGPAFAPDTPASRKHAAEAERLARRE
jgi:hypothetical protein